MKVRYTGLADERVIDKGDVVTFRDRSRKSFSKRYRFHAEQPTADVTEEDAALFRELNGNDRPWDQYEFEDEPAPEAAGATEAAGSPDALAAEFPVEVTPPSGGAARAR